MTVIEEKYQALSGVNLEEQRKLWNERGKGYYGEFLVFQALFTGNWLPGNYKLLMNLQIPAVNSEKTEIDLLLIHETGLYVFEVKHYKGTIYGKSNDATWTQFFKTEPNQKFKSPIKQNRYHIDSLKKMYPQIPIHSYIVFTNDECDLRVECAEPDVVVCKLRQLAYILRAKINGQSMLFDAEKLDEVFRNLMQYAPLQDTLQQRESTLLQQEKALSGPEVPIWEYLGTMLESQKNALKQTEENCNARIKKSRRRANCTTVISFIICAVTVTAAVFMSELYKKVCDGRLEKIQNSCEQRIQICQNNCEQQIKTAYDELASFAAKFEYVGPFNNGEIVLAEDLILVSDIVLENATDVEDTVNFSCVLNWNGETYGIHLLKNTKYMVILQDGSAMEYDLFGKHFIYTTVERIGVGSYLTFQIPTCEFYGIRAEDIAYIKLTNVGVWKDGVNFGQDILTGYEVELYRK